MLFFVGQGISLIGTWTQQLALAWLVWALTHNKWLLGFVPFMGQILTFLVAPFAGVLADRWPRRKLLVLTQTCALIQAAILAALTLTHQIQVWHIVVLATFIGLVNGFDIPIRQSFVVEMLDRREDLPNAIALNSFIFNGARLIGPSIAGLLIDAVGEGTCFLINAVSYVAVIIALLMMRFRAPLPKPPTRRHLLGSLREGFGYTFNFAPIRDILLVLSVVSLLAMPYATLMPAFASENLHGGPKTLGYLMSAVGVGALCGAFYLASRRSVLGLYRVICLAPILLGSALIAFSFSPRLNGTLSIPLIWFQWDVPWSLLVALFLLVFAGFGVMLQMASTNTLLQTVVEDDKRGRVMSFYTMAFMGTGPLGNLWAGAAASHVGTPATIVIGGGLSIVVALLFATRVPKLDRLTRPAYIRLGIIKPDPGEEQPGAKP